MATETKTIKLILVDPVNNNNKWWTGVLYDNGDVETRWGRVGYSGDNKLFPGMGEYFLEKKRKEKEKKGYTELRTIDGGSSSSQSPIRVSNVAQVAREQIAKGKSPILLSLIDRLAHENIHNIVKSTNITYNSTTGLFTTPLGIVTPDAIIEARTLLADMKTNWRKNDNKFLQDLGRYMRLVPQNVGMRLRIESLFPDQAAFDKQSDILDSLEASYATVTTVPQKTKDEAKPDVAHEKVFDVDIDILTDAREWNRIVDKYTKTRKDQHVCKHLKVKTIYMVDIRNMGAAWQRKGAGMPNIMELWHGTKTANLLSILKNGLLATPPNTAHITGKLYGNGIYFAIHSTKSLNYSFGYWDGSRNQNCFMFLADVALGKYHIPRYGSGLPSGCDSLWAKSGQSGVINDEIVVPRPDQCNLKYLVEFS